MHVERSPGSSNMTGGSRRKGEYRVGKLPPSAEQRLETAANAACGHAPQGACAKGRDRKAGRPGRRPRAIS